MSNILQKMNELLSEGERFAVATVIKAEGSTPRAVGAKMIVREDGSIFDTIGGGKVEYLVISEALKVLEEKKPRVIRYVLDAKDAASIGMICGGSMEILIEPVEPKPTLFIVGAGHIALPLAKLGQMTGFTVAVLDDRKEFANVERFPTVEKVICGDIESTLSKTKITSSTYIVIVTRGHQYDLEALKSVINSKAAYIGMIGSKTKVSTAFQELRGMGIPEDRLKQVHAPIGLDIGAETPEEIAVSIIAEIIKVRRGGTGEELASKG